MMRLACVLAMLLAAGTGRPKQTLEALHGAARELSGDAETAPRGGDLGRVLEGTDCAREPDAW